MTEHCSRHHADLIRDLMPQRDLMVGDKVSHPTEGEGILRPGRGLPRARAAAATAPSSGGGGHAEACRALPRQI